MNFNKEYTFSIAKSILGIDSPAGYTMEVMKFVEKEVANLGYKMDYTKKGVGIISLEGESDKTVGFSAHVDTLGLMVRSINSDGTLSFVKVGGVILNTIDGEYCTIYTRDGKKLRGTCLSNSPAIHVYPDSTTLERKEENMHIRLDHVVKSKEDVEKLGIKNGDFIAIDTKTEVTETDFIKSRFLDDKISVAMFLSVLKYIKENNITPKYNIKFIISTYEEVGHGCSYIPNDIDELIAVDMGCIGMDLSCDEQSVSICAKDSSGPYDYDMISKFVELSEKNGINYCLDIYPMYGSDVSAALRGGNDIRGGLIGTGVHASHGMERTHYLGMENTMKLIMCYIQN